MKLKRILKKFRLCLPLLAALIVAGCFPEKRLIWTPDGQTAAVVTSDTLYFCDAQGNLSEPQATNVVALVWLPNSKDGVAEFKLSANSWADLVTQAGEPVANEVSAAALRLLPRFKAGAKMETVLQDAVTERGEAFAHAIQLYWRDRCPDQLMDLSPADEAELQAERSVEFATLRQFRYEGGKMALGAVIHRFLEPAIELRLSPQGTWLAYVSVTGLHALPVNGSQPATVVDNSSVAAFFDWSPDGRSLVFIKSLRSKNRQEVNLGALARRRILNAEGKLEKADDCEDLAGVLFDEASKVRCLRDGRILFSSMPLQLPVTGMEMPQREQLFALDPARYHSAIRLIPNSAEPQMPKRLFPFEVSPDETCISLLLDQGGVAIFHLDSASVEMVQPDRDDSKIQILPTWKSNGELCYVALAAPGGTNQERPLEIALWQKGQSRLLSAHWPAHVLAKMGEDDNAKPSK